MFAYRQMPDLKQQLQATLGTAYTLQRELGGGGMSRVFVAEETRFSRQVVVKVLPPELAVEVSTERFEREIAMAARLQHPHIVPVITAGESDGLPYYTMPLVAGESLRSRLAREHTLPLQQAIKYLRDVASALAYAHAHGVVHRDVKPENILVTADDALVTDFGVAKAISASATSGDAGQLTSVGLTLGTPAYMAPEQVAADPEIDQRADIYAFGCVAYEMLSGRAPFAGRQPAQLLAAHLAEPPKKLDPSLNIPAALESLVMRCLAKRPEERPQSGDEVAATLSTIDTSGRHPAAGLERLPWRRALEPRVLVVAALAVVVAAVVLRLLGARATTKPDATAAPAAISSVAVLPFDNVGGDTADLYFADGMTEELSDALARVPGLRVAGRSSLKALRGREASPRDIGHLLSVGSVLEGSVRRAGGRLRLTARLVSTSDGLSRWSNTYERELTDVFRVQDELAGAITMALRPMLDSSATRHVASKGARGTNDLVAYDLYLQGRYYFGRRGDASVRKAVTLFRQAIARDSMFARAWAGLATALASLPYNSKTYPDSVRAEVFAAAGRALAIDSSCSAAHAAMATAEEDAWHWSVAEQHYLQAMRIDSTDATALQWYGMLLSWMNRTQEGLTWTQRAVELDPLSAIAASNAAVALLAVGRIPDALAMQHRAVSLDPSLPIVRNNLAWLYREAGYPDSALAMPDAATRTLSIRIALLAEIGRLPEAAALLDDLRRRYARSEVEAYDMFDAHLGLGQKDSALVWLVRSVDKHDKGLATYLLPCDPVFVRLNSEPRFVAQLRRMGLDACPADAHAATTSSH